MAENINMDFGRRVVIDTNDVDWVPSRLPGVERRMLEREGAETGRATTVVRYAAGSSFTPHVHGGGEEFFVLDGVFSDESGDFGPGSYVRNPVGSKHKPFSTDGCTIFVKLGQFDEQDQEYVRIDANNTPWLPGLVGGLSVMPLHQFGHENVALVKWEPGTVFNRHGHWGGEEILVLDGVFEDEHGRYPKGTWIRSPHGSPHTPFSNKGCTILVKTGHLNSPENHVGG
ncbi:MAG: cupin [Rhodospirillales bacterium CG15_BIG_FIL_POST_REV_8_21_14_020_66_15]|nr:MAG: cupin [Rhodospirillales bacterium CG15_BIG_FIL_POST_REV_8_21_14_020_66_15]